METVVDLMPLFVGAYEFLKPALTLVIMTLVAWGLGKIAAHFQLKSDILSNERLQDILGRGISLGLSRLDQTLKNKSLNVNVKNEVVRLGIEYATASAPQTLKKFGVTPERLAEMVEAKLGELLTKEPEKREVP